MLGMILGKSGSGKTTSLRGLDASKTIVFSPLGKKIPIPGAGKKYKVWNKESQPDGNIIVTYSAKAICQWLQHINKNMPHITTVVIDDFLFVSAKEIDKRKDENGYAKFNDVAHDFLALTEIGNTVREDLNVYCMVHSTTEGDGIVDAKFTKAMSVGRMIEEKLASVEAQFELVLLACKLVEEDGNILYKFKTRDHQSTCKSPMNMFSEEYIDNDLELVNRTIKCYYNDDCTEETTNKKKA